MDISLMDMGKFCLRNVKHPFWMLAALIATLSSCSDGDNYVNAIPGGSMALISIDMPQQAKGKADSRLLSLKNMLHVDDLSDCGLDVSAKFYLFEAPDGNLGLCAKVKDSGDLKHWLEKLSAKGICTSLSERRGCHFAVMKNSWLVGFSDEALLVMGPVVGSAQAELRQQMVRYLKAKEETGIKSSPMFACIDTISSPVAMVAQTQAFPEKFVAPFILGAPKEADPSQIVIAAKIAVNGQCLDIDGHTFSFNKAIDAKLQKNNQVFRPLEGHYSDFVFSDKLMTLFLNVNGRDSFRSYNRTKPSRPFLSASTRLWIWTISFAVLMGILLSKSTTCRKVMRICVWGQSWLTLAFGRISTIGKNRVLKEAPSLPTDSTKPSLHLYRDMYIQTVI